MKLLLALKNLSDKELTLELTMILALTAISQCSEISNLNINFMAKAEGKYIFSFNKLKHFAAKVTAKQSGINSGHFKAHSTSLYLLPRPKCPDCLLSKFLKEGAAQLNLHGKNFIIRIFKRIKPLSCLL